MADQRKGGISWTDTTWSPIRGCSRVSEGCRNCYAEAIAARFSGPGQAYDGLARMTPDGPRWSGEVRVIEERLTDPLRWKAPRMIFVNSMSDLFHEKLSDDAIDQVFAVMALCPQHQFQCLTKRPERMKEYLSDTGTPGRVAKVADRISVAREIAAMGERRIEPIPGYGGYLVSDHGDVFSQEGSPMCVRCGKEIPDGIAKRRYCGKKCRQLDAYHRKVGHPTNAAEGTYRPMKLEPGDDGHLRVMLYRDGETARESVHRLVLTVFDRPPSGDEQGCHRDGDPTNNALPNLRWGDQLENWKDRKRHGHGRSWSKLTQDQAEQIRHLTTCGHSAESIGRQLGVSGTQVRNIVQGKQWAVYGELLWPLPQVWVGVSVEDQPTANERIPLLLETPAAIHFISYEPALSAVDFSSWIYEGCCGCLEPHIEIDTADCPECKGTGAVTDIEFIIAGGESGPGARPSHPDWFRSIRDQCVAAGVPFHFKQWGEFVTSEMASDILGDDHPIFRDCAASKIASRVERGALKVVDETTFVRVGKKTAGRLLDGRLWDQFPGVDRA